LLRQRIISVIAKALDCEECLKTNAVDHKRNENAISGFARLNIPVANKSVIAEVKKFGN